MNEKNMGREQACHETFAEQVIVQLNENRDFWPVIAGRAISLVIITKHLAIIGYTPAITGTAYPISHILHITTTVVGYCLALSTTNSQKR
ncbi:MAG: hypothetical protein KAW14_05355 [Candidatus Aegiribacteria sp.]|nr:hypothetical protein [Candidatus Aegiribacteria sp.]